MGVGKSSLLREKNDKEKNRRRNLEKKKKLELDNF